MLAKARIAEELRTHVWPMLEAGRIVEEGTHAGLLAAGGRYAQLWLRQQSDEENAA